MELKHLRYLLALGETLDLREAALRLNVTPPAVTQRVKLLEEELQTQLVVRTARSLALTPAGQLLAHRARRIMENLERAARDAARLDRGEIGSVSVGFVGSLTFELLPVLARTFRSIVPEAELTLRGEMLSAEQADALLDGSLDVGLLRPPVESARLSVEVIREEGLCLLVPYDHHLARSDNVRFSDLAHEDLLMPAPAVGGSYGGVVTDACVRGGFAPRIAMEVRDTWTLLSYVAAGVGVAVAPAALRHVAVPNVRAIPLRDRARVALAVAWKPSNTNPAVHRFVQLARTLTQTSELAQCS